MLKPEPSVQFENPKPTEGINVSGEHPLTEFMQLVAGLTVVSLLIILILSTAAGWLAQRIPFSYEQSLVQDIEFSDVSELNIQNGAEQERLQALAERLSTHMDLPSDMRITVHYSADATVNALATLGGNVLFFQGLLDELDSEQAVAAVMAHEIAHVKLRHPIVAAGKGLTIATLAAFMTGASSSSAGSWLISNSMQLSLLSYSRSQESKADALAAAALHAEYGTIIGALELFEVFESLEQDSIVNAAVPPIYRSHPFSKQRATALKKAAEKYGWSINSNAI